MSESPIAQSWTRSAERCVASITLAARNSAS
jgi:hypothetical protein